MSVLLAAPARNEEMSTQGIVLGVAVLVAFLVVCYAIGKAAAWFKNGRFNRAWSPLLPVLGDARITSDGGVAVTSRLSGTYRGASVHALMTPNVAHKYSPGRNGNVFSVAVENVPGGADWSIVWNVGLPLVGNASWVIRSPDVLLTKRLEDADAVAAVDSFGRASTHYRVRDRTLEWSAYIEPRVILAPDHFRHVLDALLSLAAINKTVNPA
ncbi:MAG TPA: hypothetical protein VGH20_07440 [Myxococcales bacterium]|jgi:hypothetical protein